MSSYIVSKVFTRRLRISAAALHIRATAPTLSVGAFTILMQVFVKLVASGQRLHLRHTMTPDLFPLCSTLCNTTESDSQHYPGVQVQSHLSTFGFGSIFFSLSLSFLRSPGGKPKIVLDVSHRSYRKCSSGCISPSVIQVGGVRVGGDRTGFFCKSFQSKTNKLTCLRAALEGNSSHMLLLGG